MSNLTRSSAVSALLALLLLAIVGSDASGPRIYPRTWRKVPVPSRFWVARGGASEPDSTAADGEPVQISEPIQSEGEYLCSLFVALLKVAARRMCRKP